MLIIIIISYLSQLLQEWFAGWWLGLACTLVAPVLFIYYLVSNNTQDYPICSDLHTPTPHRGGWVSGLVLMG